MASRPFFILIAVLGLALLGVGPAGALSPPSAADQAEIVFANGGRIVSIKADGSDRRVLTRKGNSAGVLWTDRDSAPTVSPDGQVILFSRGWTADSSRSGIFSVSREGGRLLRY